MNTIEMLDKICEETGHSPDIVCEIATRVLRELHYVATFDNLRTTAMLMQCFWSFGAESIYHLGGILASCEHPDDPWVSETLARFVGCDNEEFNAVREQWLKLAENHEGEE